MRERDCSLCLRGKLECAGEELPLPPHPPECASREQGMANKGEVGARQEKSLSLMGFRIIAVTAMGFLLQGPNPRCRQLWEEG